MLFHLFREFYKDQIIGAHIIPNLALLEEWMEQRNYNLKKLGYYVEHNNKSGARATIKLGTKFYWLKREKLDAVNYYKKRIQEIDIQIKELKAKSFKENTGIAFVTFSSKDAQKRCIKDFNKIKNSPVGFINKQLRIQDWNVERWSYPSDIIWRNLNRSHKTRILRKVLIFIAILWISFLWITPLTFIDKLDYIRIKEEEFNIFSVVTESYISPFLLFFISSVLIPWVIRKIASYEFHELKSRKESTIMNKNYIFIFLNWTIVPLVNLTMLQTFIINRQIDYDGFLERVTHSTEFLLRFLIQITFVSWTIQLLASPYFATKKFKKWVNHEYSEENWEFQEWFFNIGYSVPYNSSIFTLVLLFSTIVPLVLPLGSIFFYIKYLFDKYNLIYVWPEQFESAGKISRNKPITYSIIAIVLYQIAMVVVFIVTKDVLKYVTLIILSLIGFGGIIYVIKKDNSKLSIIDGKKQRKVSIILNHKNNEKQYSYQTNVVLDEENKDEIVELLRNAYIHPWEKNFHAPVFKRGTNKRNSVRFLFDIDEDEESKKCKSEGDNKERHSTFTSEEDNDESRSDSHANEKANSSFKAGIQ